MKAKGQIIQCNNMQCSNNKNGFCKAEIIYVNEEGKCENAK